MNATDVMAARTAAVAATIDRIRAIEAERGVNREALASIREEMLKLAAQEHLFPSSEFAPPPAGVKGAKRYLLQEDADGRFALYLNALNPGNESKPHNHTTWACIAAVEGQELNRLYDRLDDGSVPGRADLREAGQVMVEPGNAIAFLPDDIHSIHTTGDRPTRHLHMYGLALERLDERLGFDPEAGTVQPYNKAFMTRTANR
ncbi:cysteine dioxygenase family protein [Roseomonas sp. NAR14]|uniref:Cysteine dioxygenase family protein n=1 Tax=Roseomonas acroporae TaxID=2937791 RepID=A0A9X1YAP3_9PROT|nr:cysteine dioxygenase family protein [Roseomonas acroporae]MCK8786651.1 cysteine dioxygenase family protein [Roseomonas acroporae]